MNEARPAPETTGQVRRALGLAMGVAVVIAGGIAIYDERRGFQETLHRLSVGEAIIAFGCGLIGAAATFPLWREVLVGLGVTMPWSTGAGVFFTSQLGKYLPGSVWPLVMQMEAGRRRGASRRTMIAANLIAIVLGCCVGLILACLLLPLYDSQALSRYWWAFLALPVLLALLHPRAITGLLDKAFLLIRRPPLGERLAVRSEVVASGWSVASWIALGFQLTVLCIALGHGGLSTVLLCTGAMALGYSLGILFIPAPAGAGIRDVVLVLVLESILPTDQALAVVVASRVMLIASDLLLAATSVVMRRAVEGS